MTDGRRQLVLDCLNAEAPPFAKGTLAGVRARLIENDLDRAVVERSVQLAAATKGSVPGRCGRPWTRPRCVFFLIRGGEQIWAWLFAALRTNAARRVHRAGSPPRAGHRRRAVPVGWVYFPGPIAAAAFGAALWTFVLAKRRQEAVTARPRPAAERSEEERAAAA